jgi:hypothetical protein
LIGEESERQIEMNVNVGMWIYLSVFKTEKPLDDEVVVSFFSK